MSRPALFVDRDGTLIREVDFLHDPMRVELIPGVGRAVAEASAAGYAIVMVSNQSGIARGFFTEGEYEAVQGRLRELLAVDGAALDGEYHCPHYPDVSGPCECRKPGLAMYQWAAADLDLDLTRSWCIGDRWRDVTPAALLGGRGALVRTGWGERELAGPHHDYPVVADLPAALQAILGGTLGV